MGKHTSSNWLMGAIYGGLVIGVINPIAGALTAFVCYKTHKKYEAAEKVEREQKATKRKRQFRRNFYARQNFASYEIYLLSEVWRAKRLLVIERANGKCESSDCPHAIEEVHHQWYPKVWGHEPISALAGLCKEHHRAEHERRR